jgi:hypothetical protein
MPIASLYLFGDKHDEDDLPTNGELHIDASFGQSHWFGLRNVRDSQGNPISEFSTTSESGTDYLTPTPEPSTLLLFTLAAAALLPRRRCLQ